MSRPVDAIVLEYNLGLLNGLVVAAEIKQVQPKVPIVLLVDHQELPAGALKSVDALVAKSDGAHYLWATVHFVLSAKLRAIYQRKSRHVRRTRRPSPWEGAFSTEM